MEITAVIYMYNGWCHMNVWVSHGGLVGVIVIYIG